MKTSVYPSACGDIPGTLLRIAEAQELLMISKSCKSLEQCEASGDSCRCPKHVELEGCHLSILCRC